MKARLYVNNRYIGELSMDCPLISGGTVRDVTFLDKVTVAFVREHGAPSDPKMFAHGVVERA